LITSFFFGSPAVAVPFLAELHRLTRVCGVVTAPDKPAGRGYSVAPSAVKIEAQRLGLPVHQPASLKEWDFPPDAAPDLGLVVAYGKLIPPRIFTRPRFGLVNVHFSLLPRRRGAAPVQWVLASGDAETGVTLFQIDAGLDTGPVYLQKARPIASGDDADALFAGLTRDGIGLIGDLVKGLEGGTLAPSPQVGEPTLAPILRKEDGRVRWGEHSAPRIVNRIRGFSQWPGVFARFRDAGVKLKSARAVEGKPGALPGAVTAVEAGRGFVVQCADGGLFVERVHPEGRKEMPAGDFANGARLTPGDRFD
jgi:methionyl-tRNA formyltransferase